MKKTNFFLAGISFITLLILGCETVPKLTTDVINGTWENVNDELIIDTVDNTLLYNAKDGTVYEGNEIVVKEINNKSGTVFFKQTKAYERCFEDPDDASWNKTEMWYNDAQDIKYEDPKDASYTHWLCWWRYSTTAPGVGKWFAMSYKNLSDEKISIRFPWKENGRQNCDSLEEAESEYTIENGYYQSYENLIRKS